MNKNEAANAVKEMLENIEKAESIKMRPGLFDKELVFSCVENGLNVNSYYSCFGFGRSPLFLVLLMTYESKCDASEKDIQKLAEFFFKNGADIQKQGKNALSTLGIAIKNFCWVTAEYLYDFGVTGKSDSKNLLFMSIDTQFFGRERDRGSLVSKLIKSNFDINITTKSNDHNLLTMAAENNLVDVVKVLLDAGFDPDCTNKYNATALMYACGDPLNRGTHLVQNKGLELVKLLLSYGADKDIKTTQRRTALSIAKKSNHHSEEDQQIILELLEA